MQLYYYYLFKRKLIRLNVNDVYMFLCLLLFISLFVCFLCYEKAHVFVSIKEHYESD